MNLTNTSKSILRIATAATLLAAAFWLHNQQKTVNTLQNIIIQTDTLTLRDTLIIQHPVHHTIRIVDSIIVTTTDTLCVRDTVYISLPRKQYYYKAPDYEAWISGYRPTLDSLHINQKQQIITTQIKENPKSKRWAIGIQVGYGATINGNVVQTTPYIGVGINWNILTF